MSELPDLPEIKDSDWGWECRWCLTKIGKACRPMGTCSCGQPWIVLDAEGKRTDETFPPPGGCQFCGMTGGFHTRGCATWLAEQPTPPAVYDLAEFERQLEKKADELWLASENDQATAIRDVLDCLRASKREAK